MAMAWIPALISRGGGLGYLYPPTVAMQPPPLKYIRHGKGGNYAWVDCHVSMTSWKTMSAGVNGKLDWYYQPTR